MYLSGTCSLLGYVAVSNGNNAGGVGKGNLPLVGYLRRVPHMVGGCEVGPAGKVLKDGRGQLA